MTVPDELRQRLQTATQIIRDLADTNPCDHWDHHGYCQTHGWLEDGECADARAQRFLREAQDD